MSQKIFHVGGQLPPDSSFYVEREADRQALFALLDMAYIYLQAPRQQGTTSLIKRLIKHPLLTNLVFAYLDMTELDWTNEAQWYWSFYKHLTRSQEIQQWMTPEWVHYSLDLSGCHGCLTNIAQKANADEKNVVIALDKFGVVWKEWGSSFLSLLRSLYNARPIKPELKRLTFIIAGPFIPENLTEQIETSPFNVSVNLQLDDFSEDQVRLLLKALNYWDERNALLSKRIWFWTSGQPYLTQLICHHLSQYKRIPNREDIDRLAQNLPTEDQEHIMPFLDRLKSDQKLVQYIKRIQTGQQIRYTPRYNRRQRQLELLGVLKADASGYCMIRNRIYEQALLAAETPESTPPSSTEQSESVMNTPTDNSLNFEIGLNTLKIRLQSIDPDLYLRFTTLESRLRENMQEERDFGINASLRSQRARIIQELNRLALTHCQISFNDLCRGKTSSLAAKREQTSPQPPPVESPTVKPIEPAISAQDSAQPTSSTSKHTPTIAIITALPKEFAAMRVMLSNVQRSAVGGGYFMGQIEAENSRSHQIVLALMSDMGTNPAAVLATRLRSHFPTIEDIIMVGIAGGVPHPEKPNEHVRLGDVVVSNRNGVVQYDFDKEGASWVIHRHPPRPPSARLLLAVRLLEANELMGEWPWLEHMGRASKLRHATRPKEETDILADCNDPSLTIAHPDDPYRVAGQPRIFSGPIASANKLLKNALKRDALRDKFGVKAIEMEGSGIADATWNDGIGYLVVRGICDYCDGNKNDLWQGYAAVVAAAYTRALLESMPA